MMKRTAGRLLAKQDEGGTRLAVCGGVRSLSARNECGGQFLWDNRITRSGDQRGLNFQLCFDSAQSLSRKRASARACTLSSPPHNTSTQRFPARNQRTTINFMPSNLDCIAQHVPTLASNNIYICTIHPRKPR